MKNKVNIAIEIATRAHDGQTDRDGLPYILHPLTVGLMGNTDEERMAGFLHDVIEDTEYSADDILKAGIPKNVVMPYCYLPMISRFHIMTISRASLTPATHWLFG